MSDVTERVAVGWAGYGRRDEGRVQLCGDGLAGLDAGDEVRVRVHGGRVAVVRLDAAPTRPVDWNTYEAWGKCPEA